MIKMYDIINSDERVLNNMGRDLGLTYDEMLMLKDYFRGMGRNPSDIEIQAIAQAWSEHSCYKSSKVYLKKYFLDLKSDYTILTMEDDAAVVSFNDDYAYVVKMESHNHPSAIEPYGGAATGVGGIIRDVLCMGAQPVALVDSLYFGNPDSNSGFLSERFILNNVVAGIRDYGNRMGIPTVSGSAEFDDRYNGMPLVNAGCIGIVRKDKVVRSRVTKLDDLLIVCGGRTGRDGIHGVNFASKILDENDENNRKAVQLGNPIIEEPLIHAVLEANDLNLIDGMKDLGGGGLSSAVSEMLYAGNVSAVIDLNKVLLKDNKMEPWEIWVSESQERMFLAVDKSNLEKIDEIFKKWGIEYSVIGKTVKADNLIINYNNKRIMDMDLKFLVSGPLYSRNFKKPEANIKKVEYKKIDNYKDFILKFIGTPNLCSRFNIVRQYDFTVRGNTVLKPFAGNVNMETHSDSAVIKPVENSYAGLCITSGSRPKMVDIDPYNGTIETLIEAYKNILCSDGDPHSIIDALNFGNPENPETMYRFIETVHAISDFCKNMGLPLVSGNVSFYNETGNNEIMPTPNILMIGKIDDIRNIITVEFKEENNPVFIVGTLINSLAGSEYAEYLNINYYNISNINYNELLNIKNHIKRSHNFIKAMHDVSSGGLLLTMLEMSFGNKIGINADLKNLDGDTDIKLFSELGTSIVIEVDKKYENEFINNFQDVNIKKIGYTVKENIIIKDNKTEIINEKIINLRNAWEHGLDKYI